MRSVTWLSVIALSCWTLACGDDEPSQPVNELDSGLADKSEGACDAPLLACGDQCVDPRFDPEHCGGCGEACSAGMFCDDRACVARNADAACDPLPDGSTDDPDGATDEGNPEPAGLCCEGRLEGGCGEQAIEECVCAVDEFCCTLAWDEVCVALVTSEGCGSCGGTDPSAPCEPSESADALPAMLTGMLDGAANHIEMSCGTTAESEIVFAYTAPEAGMYTFDTTGSVISDTVLAVLDGNACDAPELACNDDDGENLTSRITVELSAGQEILLAVESWGSELGAVEVGVTLGAVEPFVCAPMDLGSNLPMAVSGTVSDGASGLSPTCALSSEGEVLYAFTAPAAGHYRFDTTGSTSDTILQILDADCEGEELACNDDSAAGGLAAMVDVELAASQTVVVSLDSFSGEGDFELSVALATDVVESTSCCVEHESASCDDAAIAACVCAGDDYCCNNAWDTLCVLSVEDLGCGGC